MLFFRESRAVAVAETAVRQGLAPYINILGQPPMFWIDPFVLGYTGGITFCCARMLLGKSITLSEHHAVLRRVVVSVSTLNPQAMVSRIDALLMARDADYENGAALSAKFYLYTCGITELLDDDPHVMGAAAMAKFIPGPTHRASLAAAMYQIYIYSEFDRRFGRE